MFRVAQQLVGATAGASALYAVFNTHPARRNSACTPLPRPDSQVGGARRGIWSVAACEAVSPPQQAMQGGGSKYARINCDLPRWRGPERRAGEPAFTKAEVATRDGAAGNALWVTYRDGVYDVTEFQREHPGGNFIEQAAGGPVDAMWQKWAFHHLSPKVVDELERHRVGALSDWSADEDCLDDGGAYADEPTHRGSQRPLLHQPWTSETSVAALRSGYLTPNHEFFVRNHAPVPPAGTLSDHEISFGIDATQGGHDGASEIDLPLELLCGLFTPITVTSVVQCTGNRAKDSIVAHPTEPNGFVGTPLENIEAGMLGNAQWTGPRLADILTALFPTVVRGSNLERWHVEFEGIDGYSASVPLARVLARENDCILATHMNGEPIPRDHGSPVRALLPGVVGARNVKWVCRVRLLDHESTSPWNAKYYKVGASGTVKASAEQLVMQALVLSPAAAAPCPPDGELLDVSGVAYSGGSGNRIVSVQARIGDGDTWVDAVLHEDEVPRDDSSRRHGWVRWSASVPVPPGASPKISCRAVDEHGESTPAVSGERGGYLYNGYHTILLEQETDPGAAS